VLLTVACLTAQPQRAWFRTRRPRGCWWILIGARQDALTASLACIYPVGAIDRHCGTHDVAEQLSGLRSERPLRYALRRSTERCGRARLCCMVLTCVVERRRHQAQMRNHDCIPFAPAMRLRRMQYGIRVGGSEKSAYGSCLIPCRQQCRSPSTLALLSPTLICHSRLMSAKSALHDGWLANSARSFPAPATGVNSRFIRSPDSRVHPVLQVHQHCMKQIRAKKVSQALVALSLRYSGHVCLRPRIAVGTLIAKRPPHRTERARLRHSAPTLGV
jgi:hypothetical protein